MDEQTASEGDAEKPQTFADRVCWLLQTAGLKPAAAAELLGISRAAVDHHATGRRNNPTTETGQLYAGVFGCTVGWLLAGEGEPPTKAAMTAAIEAARSAARGGDGPRVDRSVEFDQGAATGTGG